INQVDPAAFNVAPLRGCENDARAMFELAADFSANLVRRELFLGPEATFRRVDTAIRAAAAELDAGDLFLFTFAGHGSQTPDTEFDDDDDFSDEELVLFDRVLIDDYLRRALWSRFRPGVRIVGVNDSCHSGSGLFAATMLSEPMTPAGLSPSVDGELPAPEPAVAGAGGCAPGGRRPLPTDVSGRHSLPPRVENEEGPAVVTLGSRRARQLTRAARRSHVEMFAAEYESLREEIPTGEEARVRADLLTLSACGDGEETLDGDEHGVFTQALLDVLRNAPENYDALRTAVNELYVQRGLLSQTSVILPERDVPAFRTHRPFSV
ncbi:MAG TPA: caspase family protein, partial [Pyrinomonadaceae bacterium]